jgi:hypothetical protein
VGSPELKDRLAPNGVKADVFDFEPRVVITNRHGRLYFQVTQPQTLAAHNPPTEKIILNGLEDFQS